MTTETTTKKIYHKEFFMYNYRHPWFIIPTVVFFYNKHTFLNTGEYTPAWGLTIRWLTFMAGIQIQEGYEQQKN